MSIRKVDTNISNKIVSYLNYIENGHREMNKKKHIENILKKYP